MKKFISLFLCIALICGCTAALAEDVIVFAAASMTETMNQIIEMYKTVAPDVTIVPNYDSSGKLKTQIQEGAECDLFISASPKQMNQMDISADPAVNTEGLDFVKQGTRITLLENKLTLVVPEGNPKGIESFEQLVTLLKDSDVLLCIGNSDVPAGQYASQVLKHFELDEAALAGAGKITYANNVKEVTAQVLQAAVDCGVIYATDAFSAKLQIVDSATPDMCNQILYPAAVMTTGHNPDGAQDFLNYLKGAEAAAVFEAVGFSVQN